MPSLTVIAPLGGASILSATFFASIGLSGAKERLTPLKTLGVLLVVGGIAIVAVVGPRPDGEVEDLEDAFDGYASVPFLIYQLVTCAALAAIFTSLAMNILPMYTISRVVLCALTAGLASGLCQALIKLFATCLFEVLVRQAQPWTNPLFVLAGVVFAVGVVCVVVGIVVLWRQRRLDALPVKITQVEEPADPEIIE